MKLTPDPANPNRMDAEDKARMAQSLAEFGDLSGIVLNARTGLLVGGHQRADVLAGAKMHVKDLAKPEPDGTVGRGWLEHGGRRYAVRVVDWAPGKAHAALLAANRFGRVGRDDEEQLRALLEELKAGATDMDKTGFAEEVIEALIRIEDGRDGDRSGASPWDRVGDAAEGVMFSFGEVHCRLSVECYQRFLAACPELEIAAWLEGVFRACITR